ncbi:MAG: hypothetical protein HFJ65_03080 [Eggerthellaceae bacterium]|nr:hypothetical protein [Eggerthellaceae bacterium]
MAEASLQRQFAGQARLVRLLLWRIGETTDVEQCLSAAMEAGMISADDEPFLRTCLQAEEAMRESGHAPQEVDAGMVARLRRCADKLNRADSA